MIPAFEIMAPRRTIYGLIEEKAYGNGNRKGKKYGAIAKHFILLFSRYIVLKTSKVKTPGNGYIG